VALEEGNFIKMIGFFKLGHRTVSSLYLADFGITSQQGHADWRRIESEFGDDD
jgi:hypothetical protein